MSKNLNLASGAVLKAASPAARAKKIMQGLVGAAAVVFLAGAGGVYLILSKIQATQQRAAAQTALAGSSQQIASRYQATLDSYDQTEDQLRFLEASVSQQAFVPTLLQQLQALATSTQLSVTSVRPGMVASTAPVAPAPGGTDGAAPAKAAAPLPYSIQPITLSVSGTYPQLMRFVYSLPHFPKILSLQSVNLHPDATGPATAAAGAAKDAEPKLTAEIVLNAYVFNADPAAQAAAQATTATPQAAPAPAGSAPGLSSATVDRIDPGAGRVVGAAHQDAQAAAATTAQTPIAAPTAPQGR